MLVSKARCAGIVAAALLLGGGSIGPAMAQADQKTPTPTEMPSTHHQEQLLRPVPDTHGRAGNAENQTHATDAASPDASSAEAAAPGSQGKTDMPATPHQEEVLKTVPPTQEGGAAPK